MDYSSRTVTEHISDWHRSTWLQWIYGKLLCVIWTPADQVDKASSWRLVKGFHRQVVPACFFASERVLKGAEYHYGPMPVFNFSFDVFDCLAGTWNRYTASSFIRWSSAAHHAIFGPAKRAGQSPLPGSETIQHMAQVLKKWSQNWRLWLQTGRPSQFRGSLSTAKTKNWKGRISGLFSVTPRLCQFNALLHQSADWWLFPLLVASISTPHLYIQRQY